MVIECLSVTVRTTKKSRGLTAHALHKAKRPAVREHVQAVDLFGGLGRNRTTDTRIFNPHVLLFAFVDFRR